MICRFRSIGFSVSLISSVLTPQTLFRDDKSYLGELRNCKKKHYSLIITIYLFLFNFSVSMVRGSREGEDRGECVPFVKGISQIYISQIYIFYSLFIYIHIYVFVYIRIEKCV